MYFAGPEAVAVSDAELRSPRHGYMVYCGGGDKRAFPHQPEKRQQPENRPASAFAKELMAEAYSSSATHTSGGHAVTGATNRKHHYEDAHIVHRSLATGTLVLRQVRSFAPGWLERPKLSLATTRQVTVICTDEGEGSRESSDRTAGDG